MLGRRLHSFLGYGKLSKSNCSLNRMRQSCSLAAYGGMSSIVSNIQQTISLSLVILIMFINLITVISGIARCRYSSISLALIFFYFKSRKNYPIYSAIFQFPSNSDRTTVVCLIDFVVFTWPIYSAFVWSACTWEKFIEYLATIWIQWLNQLKYIILPLF